jgi:hypothetical protein
MQAFDPGDLATATQLYESITDANAKRLFDYLIDHPDVQRTAGELQQELGFADHRDVARSTFLLGTLAAALGRSRPWGEGQMGYQMPADMAALFREARGSRLRS